ncbi:hypothetical protein WJX81_002473 [Elliptochloris bilobata]|uniref:Clathrin light chain n=1 Tax=Elliptochloris bilobata TaxID=381761 RepID=A0AAW1S7V2_9CHLO
MEEDEEPPADGINFFGSNASNTRHFRAEEEDSDDEETQNTEPEEELEQVARIASLEQDKATLAADNQRLQAEGAAHPSWRGLSVLPGGSGNMRRMSWCSYQ